MSDIFKKIEEEEARTLYKNEAILSVDYTPKSLDEVKHRKDQKERIIRSIGQAIKPNIRSELYVFGLTGVGKTNTVKAVINDLPKDWVKKIQYVWVNCKKIRPISEYQILYEIATHLGWRKRKKRGFARKDFEDYIVEAHQKKPLLIVLDEVDMLVEEGSHELLYTFIDSGISLILISNDFGWVDKTDERFQSRSKSDRVDFEAYTKEEMTTILRFIVNKGLRKGVMSDQILERISEEVVSKYLGDVRKGKNLILACVHQAMQEGVEAVTEEHLAKAHERVKPMSLMDKLDNFSNPELVALASYVWQRIDRSNPPYGKGAPATTENVHYFYLKCAELNDLDAESEVMMKNYLSRLVLGGILKFETKSYKTRGRTNFYYSPDYKPDEIVMALRELGRIEMPRYLSGLVPIEDGLGKKIEEERPHF